LEIKSTGSESDVLAFRCYIPAPLTKATRTMSHHSQRQPQQHQQQQQHQPQSQQQNSWGTDLSQAFPYSDHVLSFMYSDGNSNREQQPPPAALSTDEMHQRRRYRDTVLNETSSHLLVHPHHGMMDTGRNILQVLHDRERRGSGGVTSVALWRRSRAMVVVRNNNSGACDANSVSSQSTKRAKNSSKIGYQSPSTVLESPLQRANNRNGSAGAIATTVTTSHVDVAASSFSPQDDVVHDSMDETDDDQQSVDDCEKFDETLPSDRRVTYPLTIGREIQAYGEYCAATKYHSAFLTHLGGDDPLDAHGNRPASSRAVSTISVAFAPDGLTMASTHGDHTVKLSCCSTGRLLQTLDGHPRTPWTVKYHPTDSRIVASGCLGQQVRVWNWKTKACLQMIRLEFAIISLSFHPSGTVLAIANGTRLHLWGVDDVEPESSLSHGTSLIPREQPSHNHHVAPNMNPHQSQQQQPVRRAARLTEWDQRHMLRCVHFPPNGTTLIIGGVNPAQDDVRRSGGSRRQPQGGGGMANGTMSFYLRLWDFDLERALDADGDTTANLVASPISISMARRSISNVRSFTGARCTGLLRRYTISGPKGLQ
jgi:activating molecule in BECN1-regulated autophagy protein 1